MRILLVDDSPTTLKLIKCLLNEIGYEDIVMTESPSDALNIINDSDIDVALLDWHMPEMNGLELLNILKNDKKTRSLPVLMVTVEDEINMVKTAIESGAEGYLVKPINKELLKIRLEDIESSNTLGLKK